jgi:hypothetical protein
MTQSLIGMIRSEKFYSNLTALVLVKETEFYRKEMKSDT